MYISHSSRVSIQPHNCSLPPSPSSCTSSISTKTVFCPIFMIWVSGHLFLSKYIPPTIQPMHDRATIILLVGYIRFGEWYGPIRSSEIWQTRRREKYYLFRDRKKLFAGYHQWARDGSIQLLHQTKKNRYWLCFGRSPSWMMWWDPVVCRLWAFVWARR